MHIGFDPGAHELRVMWQRGAKLIARYQRSAYAILPDTPEIRQALVDSRVAFARSQQQLVLLGEPSEQFRCNFRSPIWPLLPGGQIEPDGTLSRAVLVAQLEALIPQMSFESSVCALSIPSPKSDFAVDSLALTRQFLMEWIRRRGYHPVELSPGKALVLAELSRSDFTGLAVTFGAGSCCYSLCYEGQELLSGSVARGGQWVDLVLAERFGQFCLDESGREWPDTAAVSDWKYSAGHSLTKPQNPEELLLQELYTELFTEIYQSLADDLLSLDLTVFQSPIPLLIAGGLTPVEGFLELLSDVWFNPGFPIPIESLAAASPSPFTIARGCLIYASLFADLPPSVNREPHWKKSGEVASLAR